MPAFGCSHLDVRVWMLASKPSHAFVRVFMFAVVCSHVCVRIFMFAFACSHVHVRVCMFAFGCSQLYLHSWALESCTGHWNRVLGSAIRDRESSPGLCNRALRSEIERWAPESNAVQPKAIKTLQKWAFGGRRPLGLQSQRPPASKCPFL